MPSKAPKNNKPVNAADTPTVKPELQYFTFVYRYDMPLCIPFEVEAYSEHEAKVFASAALDRGLFSRMEGDPVGHSEKTTGKVGERVYRSVPHEESSPSPIMKLRLWLSEETST